MRTDVFDMRKIGSLDLDPNRSLDAGQFHVETVLDGHGPGIGETRKLKLGIHLANQLLVGHAGTPLLARLEHDGGVVHIEGRIIRGAGGSSYGVEDRGYLRKGADNAVLFL